MADKRTLLDIVTSLALLTAAGVVVWATLLRSRSPAEGRPELVIPKAPISLQGAAIKGNPTAKVAVVVYSDFQCPYCAQFANKMLPVLEERYASKGLILVAFKHLPLETIHPFAIKAAAAAECGANQRPDGFWIMHDALFSAKTEYSDKALTDLASGLGFESSRFSACVSGPAPAKIARDAEEAKALGVRSTPTIFVGMMTTASSVSVLRGFSGVGSADVVGQVIEKALGR